MATSLESLTESILAEALQATVSSGPSDGQRNQRGIRLDTKTMETAPSNNAAISRSVTKDDNMIPPEETAGPEVDETLRRTVTKLASEHPERSDATVASTALNDPKSTPEQIQQASYTLLIGEVNRIAQENPNMLAAQSAARIFQDPNSTQEARAAAVSELESALANPQTPDNSQEAVEEAALFCADSLLEALGFQFVAELELMNESDATSATATLNLSGKPATPNTADDDTEPVTKDGKQQAPDNWTPKQKNQYMGALKKLKRDIGGDLVELRSDLNELGYRSDLKKNAEVTKLISAIRDLTKLDIGIKEYSGWFRRKKYGVGTSVSLLAGLAAAAGLGAAVGSAAGAGVTAGIVGTTAAGAGIHSAKQFFRNSIRNRTPGDVGYSSSRNTQPGQKV